MFHFQVATDGRSLSIQRIEPSGEIISVARADVTRDRLQQAILLVLALNDLVLAMACAPAEDDHAPAPPDADEMRERLDTRLSIELVIHGYETFPNAAAV